MTEYEARAKRMKEEREENEVVGQNRKIISLLEELIDIQRDTLNFFAELEAKEHGVETPASIEYLKEAGDIPTG